MKKTDKYKLDFEKSYRYFIYSLYESNKLSSTLLDVINFNEGTFFTLLSDDANLEKIHEFRWGGADGATREETAEYVYNTLKTNYKLFCIFDAVNDECNKGNQSKWQMEHSFCFENEIYYTIKKSKLSKKSILECMRVSSAIWHSLTVLTETNSEDIIGKNITAQNIEEICFGTQKIMLLAYDAEGYIFWEKNK